MELIYTDRDVTLQCLNFGGINTRWDTDDFHWSEEDSCLVFAIFYTLEKLLPAKLHSWR